MTPCDVESVVDSALVTGVPSYADTNTSSGNTNMTGAQYLSGWYQLNSNKNSETAVGSTAWSVTVTTCSV